MNKFIKNLILSNIFKLSKKNYLFKDWRRDHGKRPRKLLHPVRYYMYGFYNTLTWGSNPGTIIERTVLHKNSVGHRVSQEMINKIPNRVKTKKSAEDIYWDNIKETSALFI